MPPAPQSIKINYNIIKNSNLIAHPLNTYFLTIIEKMNNDTTTLMTEDATKYLTEEIQKTFPNIYLMPTKTNEIQSIISLSKEIHLVMMKYQ
jgi:hypothetical protein